MNINKLLWILGITANICSAMAAVAMPIQADTEGRGAATCQTAPEIHVYLAGPDVFLLPDPIAIGAQLKAAVRAAGMVAHFPMDGEITKEEFANPVQARFKIAKENERMMLECCAEGNVGIILLNMDPWKGPSMDVGTAFECGFMSALAERCNVIIVGYYTREVEPFAERTIKYHRDRGDQVVERDGQLVVSGQCSIERFGADQMENLMVTEAIRKTRGGIAKSFAEAVTLAAKLGRERIEALRIGAR